MIRRISFNRLLAALPISVLLLATPPAAADWLGISVGDRGFGLSVGVGDWAPYGPAWNDPGYSLDFDLALAGYGEWLYVSGLGRVWRPYVSGDWRPYTYGRWVYTSMGWTWVSYEPWGYVPHHYGNWAYSNQGWVWAPGYQYTPASVVWMHAGGYVGWYACPPTGWSHAHRSFWRGYDRGFHRGFDRGYRSGYRDGYWDGWDDAQYATWTNWNGMAADNVAHHAVAPSRVVATVDRHAIRATDSAPTRVEVGRRSGISVREVATAERMIRAGDRSVRMVRPEGVHPSIERNARDTVRRALSPELARKIESGEPIAERARPGRGDLGRSVRVPDSHGSAKQQPPSSRSQGSTRNQERISPSRPADRGRAPALRPSQPEPRSLSETRGPSREGRLPSHVQQERGSQPPRDIRQQRFQPQRDRRDSSVRGHSPEAPATRRIGPSVSPPKDTSRAAPHVSGQRMSPNRPERSLSPRADRSPAPAQRRPPAVTAEKAPRARHIPQRSEPPRKRDGDSPEKKRR